MDATCKVQDNIHVFRLVHNMCPGFWVHINHIDELFNFIVSGFTKTVPISATLINDQWELILNTDEGYQWYNGSLDGGPLVNNKNFSRYLKELLPFEHLIAFG